VAKQIVDAKLEGKEAFAKGDYVAAIYSYTQVVTRTKIFSVLVGIIHNVAQEHMKDMPSFCHEPLT
jgi:hypothetical protein